MEHILSVTHSSLYLNTAFNFVRQICYLNYYWNLYWNNLLFNILLLYYWNFFQKIFENQCSVQLYLALSKLTDISFTVTITNTDIR